MQIIENKKLGQAIITVTIGLNDILILSKLAI